MKTRIIHFSDTHESAIYEGAGCLLDKRLLGLLNSRVFRKRRHDQELLDHALDFIRTLSPDLVVFTGDATSCGQQSEFGRAMLHFEPFLKETSIPLIYTPGNHDSYVKNRRCRQALEDFFHGMSRNTRNLSDMPYLMELKTLRLAIIHCARPTNPFSSCGHLSKESALFLKVEAEKNDPRPLICAGHFPILEQHPIRRMRHRLYGTKKIEGLIREEKIALSLCGHVHRPYDLLNAKGYGETSAGSLTRFGELTLIEHDSESGIFTHHRISMKKQLVSG